MKDIRNNAIRFNVYETVERDVGDMVYNYSNHTDTKINRHLVVDRICQSVDDSLNPQHINNLVRETIAGVEY